MGTLPGRLELADEHRSAGEVEAFAKARLGAVPPEGEATRTLESFARRRLRSSDTAASTLLDMIVVSDWRSDCPQGVDLNVLLRNAPPPLYLRTTELAGRQPRSGLGTELVARDLGDDRAALGRFLGPRLRAFTPKAILHLPRTPSDIRAALVASTLTGAPLRLWLHDDPSQLESGPPDALLSDLIRGADLIFCASPRLRDEMEQVWRRPCWVMEPPVNPACPRVASSDPAQTGAPGILVGDVSSPAHLDLLLNAVASVEHPLVWLLPFSSVALKARARLAAAGVTISLGRSPAEVAKLVEAAAYLLVPSSRSFDTGEPLARRDRFVASRSVLDMAAQTGTPFMVMADDVSATGDFVQRFGLGEVVRYDAAEYAAAHTRLTDPAYQMKFRTADRGISEVLSSDNTYRMIVSDADAGWLHDDLQDRFYPRAG